MTVDLAHLIPAVNDRDEALAFHINVLGLTHEGESPPFSFIG